MELKIPLIMYHQYLLSGQWPWVKCISYHIDTSLCKLNKLWNKFQLKGKLFVCNIITVNSSMQTHLTLPPRLNNHSLTLWQIKNQIYNLLWTKLNVKIFIESCRENGSSSDSYFRRFQKQFLRNMVIYQSLLKIFIDTSVWKLEILLPKYVWCSENFHFWQYLNTVFLFKWHDCLLC